jgi:hypothetical protein
MNTILPNQKHIFLSKSKIIALTFVVVFIILLNFILTSGNLINIIINASGANSADLIVGQKTVGNTEEVSVCIQSNSNLNLAESTIWLTYNKASLDPSPIILKVGDFSGPADPSGNYLPLSWSQVVGRTNTWNLEVAYQGGPGTKISSTTPNLVGKVRFNKLNTSASPVNIDSTGTSLLSTQNGSLPIVTTLKNVDTDCTDFTGTASQKPSPVATIVEMAQNTVRTGGGYINIIILLIVTISILYFVYRSIFRTFSVKDIFR